MRILQKAMIVVVLGIAAAPLRAETLADALVAAYKNSNLLEQNRALLRAADEDAAVALAQTRPVISFALQSSYQYSDNRNFLGQNVTNESLTTQAAITADISIYDFGRNKLAIEAAKETVLATRDALVAVEQNVLLTAVQAYVNVRLANDIVGLRQSNVRLLNEELQAARDRFEVGEITRTDVALAQSRLAAARANLTSAQGDVNIAREAYKAAVGAYPGRLAALPRSPGTAKSLDAARSVAVRTHPSLLQAQRQVTVAELNVLRARADTRPRLTARASTGLVEGGQANNSVTLSLNQTLYAGGQLAALQRRALASSEAQRSSLLQTKLSIEQNVGNSWSNLQVAQANIFATDEQIRAAQIAFDGFREEAKLGARTTLDVLDAEQSLLDARVSRASAEATRYLGVYSLLSTMGLLTVDHLKLSVQTYDPAAYYNSVKGAPIRSIQGDKLDRILKSLGKE